MRRTFLALTLLGFTAFGQTRGRLADYALILEDPPVAEKSQSRAEVFSAAMQPHLQKIQTAQRAVLDELAQRKVPVAGASQILLNAIFVTTDRAAAMQLRSIPGVLRVAYLPRLKADLNTALPLINASAAWSALGGASNAGKGIKIGIIDSGIDQTHAAFQDSLLTPPANYPPANAAYPNNTSFTNNKVIVARSFVGLAPYADPDSRNYAPDDVTPSDHLGHGTAIAMIAAGELNTGIQGVAPKAFLGNYKVQGSPGVNDYATQAGVVAALTAALADKMDIVTVALGEGDSPLYGPLDSGSACGNSAGVGCDPLATAVQNAVALGMVVVASAGNDGDLGPNVIPTLNTIHTPGTAPAAITVGSSTNSHALYQQLLLSTYLPMQQTLYSGLFGDGPQAQAAFSAQLADVTRLGDSDGLACGSLPAGSLTGKIALIQRGTCYLDTKVNNAQNAGAVGVVIYQLAGYQIPYSSWGASDTGIPAMMIGYNDGLTVKASVDANAGAMATLNPAFSALATTADAVSAFSSRGPAIGTNWIKPDLVAPGDAIYTATQKLDPNSPMYNASGYVGVSGTSFAVGMVAGAVALVKQTNTSLTPAQLKSAVVNTANPAVTDPLANTGSAQARVTAMGAGKLNAGAAVAATTAFSPATLSFGAIGTASLPESLTLTVTNISSASQTVAFAVFPRDNSNASVVVSPTSLTLTAGQSNTVTVTLQGAAPAPGNYEGYVKATVGGNVYRIPYLYMVSDGVVYSLQPGLDGSFAGAVGDTFWLIAARAIDRYGLPVLNVPATWTVLCPNGLTQAYNVGCAASGGGSFTYSVQYCGAYCVDAATANNGVVAADVNLGTLVGDEYFTVNAGGQTLTFDGYAAGYQSYLTPGIVDAASYQAFKSPKGFAPGSYLSIFGSYLSTASQAFSTPALPYSLSEVSASFYTLADARYPGRVPYVSPNQVNVQIPWELQGQTAAYVQIDVYGEPGQFVQIPLATYSPGIFEYYDPVSQKAYAVVWDETQGYWVTPGTPAHRGDKIHVYTNGLGPVNNQPATGAPSGASSATTLTPTVTVGGVSATAGTSGLTPGYIGIYEVVVTITINAPNTGVQPLAITIGGVTSASANIPMQ